MVNHPIERSAPVPAGGDRFQEHRKVLRTMTIDYKVSALDTNGGLFVIENTNYHKGGPPRHLHHEQEEWFYVIESDYIVEIGDERYRLGPGDSILAPRRVPHVWAHVGEWKGRMLIAFQPAGEMEVFFRQLAQASNPSREELRGLFSSHGMEVTGSPLPVE